VKEAAGFEKCERFCTLSKAGKRKGQDRIPTVVLCFARRGAVCSNNCGLLINTKLSDADHVPCQSMDKLSLAS